MLFYSILPQNFPAYSHYFSLAGFKELNITSALAMGYLENLILSSLFLHAYLRTSVSLMWDVDEAMQLVFSLNSILHLSVIRYDSGVQTRTSTFFFELLKEQEFLHFVLLGPCITSFPSLPSSLHPFHTVLFCFSSQCYPRVDTILERTYFFALFDVLPTLLSHLPAIFSPIYLIFSHDVFIRKHFFSNMRVLFHLEDHQSSQVALLLKRRTKQQSLWSSCLFL